MPPDRPLSTDVTDAELAVLERLWAAPGATIRDITDKLYPNGGAAHYATVQKLLDRLAGKKLVARDSGDIPHRFSAGVARDEFIARRMRAMADQFCGGSLAPLLTNLVRAKSLKQKEIDELRELIDQLDRQPSAPRKKRRQGGGAE